MGCGEVKTFIYVIELGKRLGSKVKIVDRRQKDNSIRAHVAILNSLKDNCVIVLNTEDYFFEEEIEANNEHPISYSKEKRNHCEWIVPIHLIIIKHFI